MNIINIDIDILDDNDIKKLLDNVITNPDIEYPVKMNESYFSKAVIEYNDKEIISKIINYMESKHGLKLKCLQSQLQTWVPGSRSDIHNHNGNGREDGDYNILVYLNDDYDGGVFFMPDYNIKIKPKKGISVLFNGKYINHGVTMIEKNNRYGFILWCKEVDLYNN